MYIVIQYLPGKCAYSSVTSVPASSMNVPSSALSPRSQGYGVPRAKLTIAQSGRSLSVRGRLVIRGQIITIVAQVSLLRVSHFRVFASRVVALLEPPVGGGVAPLSMIVGLSVSCSACEMYESPGDVHRRSPSRSTPPSR